MTFTLVSEGKESMKEKGAQLRDLQRIPGVGKSLSANILSLGYHSVEELKGKDPQEMYDQLKARSKDEKLDRCVLYVFRCAVYYASQDEHDPALLKWWNWKDQKKQKSAPTSRKRKRKARGRSKVKNNIGC